MFGPDCRNMADGCVSKPSVFVVDSGMALPPSLPPKPGQRRIQKRRKRLIQNIVLVLVCLSLIGLLVEGCFIAKLYKSKKDTNSVSENSIMTPSGLTFFCLSFRKTFLLNLLVLYLQLGFSFLFFLSVMWFRIVKHFPFYTQAWIILLMVPGVNNSNPPARYLF